MTRRETLQCVHEPFGDAYYFGPERLAKRYENDEEARIASGYSESTYRTIFDQIAREHAEVSFFGCAIATHKKSFFGGVQNMFSVFYACSSCMMSHIF